MYRQDGSLSSHTTRRTRDVGILKIEKTVCLRYYKNGIAPLTSGSTSELVPGGIRYLKAVTRREYVRISIEMKVEKVGQQKGTY